MRLNSVRTLIFLSFVIAACSSNPNQNISSPAAPNLNKAIFLDTSGKDSRTPMLSTEYPWSTIGRIISHFATGNGELCTATLVGRTVALTAAHCVLNNGVVVPITFQASYYKGVFTGQASSKEITVGTNDFAANRAKDWAVIHLDAPIGDNFGYMGVRPIGILSTALAVSYSGYSDNFQKNEVAGVDANCSIQESLPDGTYGHDCSMGPGGSGGPLFSAADNEGPYILAINTMGVPNGVYPKYSTATANIAAMSDDLLKAVDQFKSLYDQVPAARAK